LKKNKNEFDKTEFLECYKLSQNITKNLENCNNIIIETLSKLEKIEKYKNNIENYDNPIKKIKKILEIVNSNYEKMENIYFNIIRTEATSLPNVVKSEFGSKYKITIIDPQTMEKAQIREVPPIKLIRKEKILNTTKIKCEYLMKKIEIEYNNLYTFKYTDNKTKKGNK